MSLWMCSLRGTALTHIADYCRFCITKVQQHPLVRLVVSVAVWLMDLFWVLPVHSSVLAVYVPRYWLRVDGNGLQIVKLSKITHQTFSMVSLCTIAVVSCVVSVKNYKLNLSSRCKITCKIKRLHGNTLY